MAYTLLWLCIAHWKALKKRDYAIILIETIMLGFAMMERPGLDMWYNFIMLYPLAKVISKPGTESVLEFANAVEPEPDEEAEPSLSDSELSEVTELEPGEEIEPSLSDTILPDVTEAETDEQIEPKEEETESIE